MDNVHFSRLSSRAWSLPVLAHLGTAGFRGCRVSPTAHAVGAGRNIVGQTFGHLVDVGMLVRAQGHGHPLRPEYQLTAQGKATAQWARAFLDRVSDEEWNTARRAWTLPVLRLVDTPRSFSHLRSDLRPVTDRGLSLCLGRLVDAELIARRTLDTSRGYLAVGRGAELADQLRETFSL